MSKLKIMFHRPSLGKEEEREVIQTLKSGWLTTGPKTVQFEKDFAKFVGAKYAIGLNSCTAGLHLALAILGIKKGDEVITSPITFPATANVIIHQNARPVFADVLEGNLNIDPLSIESKITSKTKAIIPVHFAGNPCQMNKIIKIANKHKIKVISDCAHAIETRYKEKRSGQLGLISAYSFYATKNITTGEGGMLTTNNKKFADLAMILRLHGISKDAWKRYGKGGYKHWDSIYPGYKYNMFDIQASMGIKQLKKIKEFHQKRKALVQIYNEGFKNISEIIPLSYNEEKGNLSAYHIYVVMIRKGSLKISRDEFINKIQDNGIGIGIHFRALHLQTYYRNQFNYKKGMLPVAESASDRLFSLPLYPDLKEKEVKFIIKIVKGLINKYKRVN